MAKKIVTYELNNDLNITKNNLNNIISLFPSDIVSDLTNIENYKNLDWSTFPRKSNTKNLDKQFTFYLCNSKDKKRTIDNALALRVQKISNFLQYVISLHNLKKRKKEDSLFLFNIKKTDIYNFLGKEFEEILCFLHNMKILERKGAYYTGNNNDKEAHSYSYQVAKRLIYSTESYTMMFVVDNRNKNGKIQETKTISEKYNDEVVAITDKRMIDTLISTTLDKTSALTFSINEFFNSDQQPKHLNKLIFRINYILLFGAKKYLKSGKKSKRIYSHLTFMPTELRPFLNRKFYNVDLKNSQLLILCYYAKLNNLNIDKEFIEDCEQGNIYEQFLLINNDDRRQSKVAVFSELLFDFKTNKRSLTNDLFKKLYPETWQTLKEINDNKEENGTLASKLQSMEFDIFSTTPSVCINSNFLFTLHDSIYFDNYDDKDLVVRHLEEKFKEMDLEVSFNFD